MTKNLDLEIKKALNSKIDLGRIVLFTVKIDSETKIDFRINKDGSDQQIIIANFEQMPQCIQHRYKNVTITYSAWNDDECMEVYHDITVDYETQRTIDKNEQLEPIVKEMIREIIEARTHHMQH